MRNLRTLSLIIVLSLAFGAAAAQSKQPAPGQQHGRPPMPGAAAPKPDELKKYDEVITKDAKTQTGLFKVHTIKDSVYWEIPADKLDKDLLWEAEIAQLPASVGFPGTPAGLKLIRLTRHENKIFVRAVPVDIRAAAQDGTEVGVNANLIQPVLMSFDILTEGPNKAPVIDVTPWFTQDPGEFSVKGSIGMAGVDPSKSYIDKVKAFPQNIETRSFMTFISGGRPGMFFPGAGGFGGGGPASCVVHYSLDLLPEKPMQGRLKDSRIGYFTTDFDEYGQPSNRVENVRFINRFRLEKKDPTAEVSEPVKPIVFYLPPEVPEKWRPYIKMGIEDWQPVFEKAGFKNAIICKQAPTKAQDPDWDPEDLRYSVIRWLPSRTENAEGDSVQDPRSGETISAHVKVWDGVVQLIEDWMFSQQAAVDPNLQHIPVDTYTLGTALRYVITHEVGHTLGLEHNFKASTAYTVAELRDPQFMKTHGTSSSVMSYSRFDYLAQPEDGIRMAGNGLGPYDYFAIHYGYAPISGAKSPNDEKPTLDQWLSQQVSDPTVRFGNYVYFGTDPTTQMENISNDPVEAGRLGFRNLDRIASNFLISGTTKPGEDYRIMGEMEGMLLNQRLTEILHAAQLVGGVVETDWHAGHGDAVFAPVPAAKQADAVKFLVTEGFATPKTLFEPEIMNRLSPDGLVDQVAEGQTLVMMMLLTDSRIHRMEDNEAANGSKAYTARQLVSQITDGAWSELKSVTPKVDVYRRSLQRAYLKTMDSKINGYGAGNTDVRGLARMELKGLATQIDAALPKTKDPATQAHLSDCRQSIEMILTNKFNTGSSSPQSMFPTFLKYAEEAKQQKGACWLSNATIGLAMDTILKDYFPSNPDK